MQYVESDLDDFNQQPPDCFVCFLLSENMHRWLFIRLISWGLDVCFASHSHLGSVLVWQRRYVQILMMWFRLKPAHTITNKIRRPCQDWTEWFDEESKSKNQDPILYSWVRGSGLVILLLVEIRYQWICIAWFSISAAVFFAFQSLSLPCCSSKLAVLIVWSCSPSARWSVRSWLVASLEER